MEFAPDGRKLVTVEHHRLRVWDVQSGLENERITSAIHGKTLSIDATGHYAICRGDGEFQWWDLASLTKFRSLPVKDLTTYAVRVTNNGNVLSYLAYPKIKSVELGTQRVRNVVTDAKTFDFAASEPLGVLVYATVVRDETGESHALGVFPMDNFVSLAPFAISRPQNCRSLVEQRKGLEATLAEAESLIAEGKPGKANDLLKEAQAVEGQDRSAAIMRALWTAGSLGQRKGLRSAWIAQQWKVPRSTKDDSNRIVFAGFGEDGAPAVIGIHEATLYSVSTTNAFPPFRVPWEPASGRTDKVNVVDLVLRLPSSRRVLVAYANRLGLFDLASGACILEYGTRTGPDIRTVVASEENGVVITGHDNRLAIWDAANGNCIN